MFFLFQEIMDHASCRLLNLIVYNYHHVGLFFKNEKKRKEKNLKEINSPSKSVVSKLKHIQLELA